MSGPILVCFAVPPEAKPLRKLLRERRDAQVCMTGMGARNAERAIRSALDKSVPARVFSSGFAGALDPALRIGEVVFDSVATSPAMQAILKRCGAKPVTFHSAQNVAVTAAEKSALRASTGAGAVEMESEVIRGVCAARGVECVTVRAISDAADENLPLDFNAVMNADQQLSPTRLTLALLRSPQKVPALLRLGRNSARAARNLAQVLALVLAATDKKL